MYSTLRGQTADNHPITAEVPKTNARFALQPVHYARATASNLMLIRNTRSLPLPNPTVHAIKPFVNNTKPATHNVKPTMNGIATMATKVFNGRNKDVQHAQAVRATVKPFVVGAREGDTIGDGE